MLYSYQDTSVILNSRAPLPSVHQPQNDDDPIDLLYSAQFDDFPVTCEQIRREAQRDPVLCHILDCEYCEDCDT